MTSSSGSTSSKISSSARQGGAPGGTADDDDMIPFDAEVRADLHRAVAPNRSTTMPMLSMVVMSVVGTSSVVVVVVVVLLDVGRRAVAVRSGSRPVVRPCRRRVSRPHRAAVLDSRARDTPPAGSSPSGSGDS